MEKIKDYINYAIVTNEDVNLLFYTLADDNTTYPLVVDFINSNNYLICDTDYFIGFSNDKYLSPLFSKVIGFWKDNNPNMSDKEIFANAVNELASLIYQRFGVKWKKIYDSLVASVYNPLENYNMEETRTPDLETGLTASAESKTGVFGFNGTSAKDSATNDGNSSSTTTLTGTDTLTRKGNIGVTTTQQMITQELELRKHDFYRMIYMDIDSILCLKIY